MSTKEYHKVSLYRETATLTDESITPGAPSGTLKLGASGNFGVHYLQVELGEGWQDLTVRAIFWLRGSNEVVGDSLLSGGEIQVPAAVTASSTDVGFVTFSGTSAGVNRLTATLPFIVTAGPPSEGEPAPEPDPSLWQQIFEKMEEVVSSYILPIMSEETLGGGRAIKKTTETVPVAVDPLDGRLYVPEQSGGGSDYKLPQATESTLGGVKAKQRTSETLEVAIDEATGKLYVPQQGGGGSYELPVATSTVLGGVKAPAKTSETVKVVVDTDGFLYIKDYAEKSAIPTKVSQLQNDSNFLTKESDPTVPSWAKQPQKPTYTAEEVGAQAKGDYALKNEIPTKLPNPQTLTFTGAVNKTYDGSSAVTVNIPTGGSGGGEPGAAAGFGTPTATASSLESGAEPTVQVEASGPDTAKIFAFTFGIPKGQDGAPGEPGKTPQKGTDYWTTAEQQQIVDEAATAAAKKVPVATAEQAGVVKAQPIAEQGSMVAASVLPDGTLVVPQVGGGSGEGGLTLKYTYKWNANEVFQPTGLSDAGVMTFDGNPTGSKIVVPNILEDVTETENIVTSYSVIPNEFLSASALSELQAVDGGYKFGSVTSIEQGGKNESVDYTKFHFEKTKNIPAFDNLNAKKVKLIVYCVGGNSWLNNSGFSFDVFLSDGTKISGFTNSNTARVLCEKIVYDIEISNGLYTSNVTCFANEFKSRTTKQQQANSKVLFTAGEMHRTPNAMAIKSISYAIGNGNYSPANGTVVEVWTDEG